MRAFLMTILIAASCARSPAPAPVATPAAEPDAVAPDASAAEWRYEKIDLPPEFAPDLPVRGVEELYFAPGMFDATSSTYFTYVFILQLHEPPPIDAAFLGDLLGRYFGGLMRAVATDRKINLEVADPVVSLDPDPAEPARFMARVETVDAFVTGEAVRLNIELTVTKAGGLDCIIALATPRAVDDPVWTELRVQAARFKCSDEPAAAFR